MASSSQRIPTTILDRVLELAMRAPSVHNTQPWRWRTTAGTLELRSDQRRRLMATDPRGRDLAISCGAALHTVGVAAAAEGWASDVQRLPDPTDDGLLARVTFRRRPPDDDDIARARVVQHRRTDRRQVTSWPVPPERVDRLRRTAARLGVFVVPLDTPEQTNRLEKLRRRAAQVQGRDSRYHDEMLSWSRDDAPVGVPDASRPRRAGAQSSAEPDRFIAGNLADPQADSAPAQPLWLLLSTSSDDLLCWLRTGEALQAIWLWCAAEGMSLRPHSQAIEVEEVRRRMEAELLDGTTCPQLLVSVGWAPLASDPVAPTPRLGVDDVRDRR